MTERGLSIWSPFSHGRHRKTRKVPPELKVWLASRLRAQVDEHRLHAAVDVPLLGEPEFGEDRIRVLLDRPLRDAQCLGDRPRSEEHTSELQSPMYLVCRL